MVDEAYWDKADVDASQISPAYAIATGMVCASGVSTT
jgi:hypothetical protein